jgi:glycine cleavage system aminomethyltransferase T
MQIPITSSINEDASTINGGNGVYLPHNFSGAEDELLACRKTAWLGTALNMSPVYDVSGPDSAKLLTSVCVNRDFSKLPDSSSRHAIICNDRGQMLADGVVIRIAPDTYRTYWMAPVLAYHVDRSDLDVKGTYVLDEFFFQLDGPKSLEILEDACQSDVHDLKFAHHKMISIAGVPVRVLRLGMSGALAYELHGPSEQMDQVYSALKSSGKKFGMRQLGNRHYCVNHTQAGYPNQNIHFQYPLYDSGEGLKSYIEGCIGKVPSPFLCTHIAGSCSDDRSNFYVTPYDVGWDYLIRFDHDFVGRAALEQIAKNPPAGPVTLVWNAEDVGRVFASWFQGTEVAPFDDLCEPWDGSDTATVEIRYRIEKVLAGDKVIGRSAGRIRDYYHRRMISIGYLDHEHSHIGDEVEILYGNPDGPQTRIRAIVDKYPYFDEEYRNETFDTSSIPRLA